MRPVKRSVSVAIRPFFGACESVLVVQRPADDEDLPNLWGLPAASLRDNEDWIDAVRRAGKEKLGVELEVGDELRRGSIARADYDLEMRLFEAQIIAGDPHVRSDVEGVTHYQAWQWGGAEDLIPAAQRGSLCCQLYLRSAP